MRRWDDAERPFRPPASGASVRYHHGVIPLALAVLLAGPTQALRTPDLPSAPADAAVVIVTGDAARAAVRWRATPLGALAGRRDLAALVDLAASCPGPAVVWLSPDGSISVVAEAGSGAEALAARLGAGGWPGWAGAEVRPATLGGRPAALVSRQGADLGGWARVGSRIVAATTAPALGSVVRMSTAQVPGAASPEVPHEADLAIRIDLDRLPRPRPGRFDLLAKLAPRPLDTLGTGGVVTAVLRFDPGSTRGEATLVVRQPTGAAALLASLRGTAPRSALVPEDATAFAAASFEPRPAMAAAGEILAAANPLVWIGVQGASSLAGRIAGTTPDPATRFLATLTGTATWAGAPGRPPLLALGVDPPGEAASAADAVLRPLSTGNGDDAIRRPEAARIVTLPSTNDEAQPGMAWAVRGGWIVAAFGSGDSLAGALPSWGEGSPSGWTAPQLRPSLGLTPRDAAAIAVERLGGSATGPLGRLLGIRRGSGRAVAIGSAAPAGSGRIDLALRVTALPR